MDNNRDSIVPVFSPVIRALLSIYPIIIIINSTNIWFNVAINIFSMSFTTFVSLCFVLLPFYIVFFYHNIYNISSLWQYQYFICFLFYSYICYMVYRLYLICRLFSLIIESLFTVHFVIQASFVHQFLVCAMFLYPSPGQYKNLVAKPRGC